MNKSEIISCTAAYIEQNLEEALTLDMIAEKIGYSKFYLNRMFQEETGSTIHQYIMERRLTEAARKLADTSEPLIDIAYGAGYRSQQAFTNAFGNIYRCSPLDYRVKGQWQPRRLPYLKAKVRYLNRSSEMEMAA